MMRPSMLCILLLAPAAIGIAVPAAAQVPPAEIGARTIPAPWWMRDPVIASLGTVRLDLPANRARFEAQFSAVERDAAAATAAAARRVADLDAALRAIGADRVRVTTTFVTLPLYDQYKDKDGNLVDNQRADRIDRYQVSASLDIEVRDTALLERTYNAVVAARPTSVGGVAFSLDPDNQTISALAVEAIRDATRRARAAVEATGARLGPVRIIDPTARVCRTDVLAGWPSHEGGATPTQVERQADGRMTIRGLAGVVDALSSAPLPAPAPGNTSVRVTLQPPIQSVRNEACVVFALL